MARYRLTHAAQGDIVSILARSHERYGEEARKRYEALITTAIRDAATRGDDVGRTARPERSDGVFSWRLAQSRTRIARWNRPPPAALPDLPTPRRGPGRRAGPPRRHGVTPTPCSPATLGVVRAALLATKPDSLSPCLVSHESFGMGRAARRTSPIPFDGRGCPISMHVPKSSTTAAGTADWSHSSRPVAMTTCSYRSVVIADRSRSPGRVRTTTRNLVRSADRPSRRLGCGVDVGVRRTHLRALRRRSGRVDQRGLAGNGSGWLGLPQRSVDRSRLRPLSHVGRL